MSNLVASLKAISEGETMGRILCTPRLVSGTVPRVLLQDYLINATPSPYAAATAATAGSTSTSPMAAPAGQEGQGGVRDGAGAGAGATMMATSLNRSDLTAESIYRPTVAAATPVCFPREPLASPISMLASGTCSEDVLFYIFATRQNSYQQYVCARSLKKAGWKWEKRELKWYKPVGQVHVGGINAIFATVICRRMRRKKTYVI